MIGFKELVQNFKDGLPELKDIGKEGLGILGDCAKLAGSAAIKGTVATAKFAGNVVLDAAASIGGPEFYYSLSIANPIADMFALNAEVEKWFLRYEVGIIGKRDSYAKTIRDALHDCTSDFVRNCIVESDPVTYPNTDEVESFTMVATLITGHVLKFKVHCWQGACVSKYVLRGF